MSEQETDQSRPGLTHFAMECLLLDVPGEKRDVEDQRNPVPVDQEQEGQEPMHSGFRNDIRIQAVAEVDRVDVVTEAQTALAMKRSHLMRCGIGKRRRATRGGGPLVSAEPGASIPFKIAVHDSEEDLEEEVDGIYDNRKEV